MPVKPIPDGLHSVTPYLILKSVEEIIEFAKTVFEAEVTEQIPGPDGNLAHAEIKIGDSIIMLGRGRNGFEPTHAMLYIYTPDTDATYWRALEAGATSIMEPADQFYGDRNAGVQGPQGNIWWVATHVEDVSPEELQRRAKDAYNDQ